MAVPHEVIDLVVFEDVTGFMRKSNIVSALPRTISSAPYRFSIPVA